MEKYFFSANLLVVNVQPEPIDGGLILNSGIPASRPSGTDKLELLEVDFELWAKLFGMCTCMYLYMWRE